MMGLDGNLMKCGNITTKGRLIRDIRDSYMKLFLLFLRFILFDVCFPPSVDAIMVLRGKKRLMTIVEW